LDSLIKLQLASA